MKILIIIIISYIVIKRIYKGIKNKKYKVPKCDADIVIAPCGIRGTYTAGICHYLKNHFILTDKKIVGFSSGSINNLFINLHNEKNNEFLKSLMKNKLNNDIKGYLKKTIQSIHSEFTEKDFNLNGINIGVCHSDGLHIYNNFLNLKDALDCCMSSSFIPFITYKDLLYFYKYKLSLDGGLFYRSYIKNNHSLIINHYMFNRYNVPHMHISGIRTKNVNVYQMYINGYNDARNNHDYFLKYLTPL